MCDVLVWNLAVIFQLFAKVINALFGWIEEVVIAVAYSGAVTFEMRAANENNFVALRLWRFPRVIICREGASNVVRRDPAPSFVFGVV